MPRLQSIIGKIYISRQLRKALRANCLKGKAYLVISESVSVP